jgi:predicted nuclease with RNAse H fold
VDSVVGIDLSGVSRTTIGQTALAQLSLDERPRLLDRRLFARGERRADVTLIDWVADRRPLVVAIDAPLTLPHSLGCELADCPRCRPGTAQYLMRDVDRMVGGMSTAQLASIAFRGAYLARMIRGLGIEPIETYPAGVLRDLGLTAQVDRRDSARIDAVLEPLVVDYIPGTPDEQHAICAALVAADYAGGTATSRVGSDGVIWLRAK